MGELLYMRKTYRGMGSEVASIHEVGQLALFRLVDSGGVESDRDGLVERPGS